MTPYYYPDVLTSEVIANKWRCDQVNNTQLPSLTSFPAFGYKLLGAAIY